MATISDVAAKAGVSAATVSRVLSGKPQVAESTRRRVLAAAGELGYTPSRAAQALARGRATSVGVVAAMVSSPSVAERLQGLSSRIALSGYDLTLFNVESARRKDQLLAELASPERMGAVIAISLPLTTEEVEAFAVADVPLVVVDALISGVDCVYIDNAEGGRLAARTLLSEGHRRIAFLGDTEENEFGFTASKERRIGFEEVLAMASLEIPGDYLKLGPHGTEYARAATHELLELADPPTAIFAASDVQAIGVLEAAHEIGIDIPGRLSVMGFDDIQSARGMGLATIRQPLEESGSYGAKLLLEAIEHQPMGLAIELPLSVVARRSIAPPPPG